MMSARLRFAEVTASTATTVTVTLDDASVTITLPTGLAPAVGDMLWLVQQDRTMAAVGASAPGRYDNARVYGGPIRYDGT